MCFSRSQSTQKAHNRWAGDFASLKGWVCDSSHSPLPAQPHPLTRPFKFPEQSRGVNFPQQREADPQDFGVVSLRQAMQLGTTRYGKRENNERQTTRLGPTRPPTQLGRCGDVRPRSRPPEPGRHSGQPLKRKSWSIPPNEPQARQRHLRPPIRRQRLQLRRVALKADADVADL